MNREELGNKLVKIRTLSDSTPRMSKHIMTSLEKGRSSSSAQNLFYYIYQCGYRMVVTERRFGEQLFIDSPDDFHKYVALMVDYWCMTFGELTRQIGINYTKQSISTDTMLAILNYFEAKIDFIELR